MNAYLAALARRHDARRDVLPPAWAATDALRESLALAFVLAALAAVITLTAGYHAAFHAINDAARPLSDRALSLVTYAGDTVPALLLLAPFAHRFRQLVWFAVVAALMATLFTHGLKPVINLPRPPAVFAADVFRLVGPAYGHVSFPSGHSVTAFVTAAVLGWHVRQRWLRALLVGVAALVALSRVAVGAHWPVDTLGGAALGLLATAVAAHLLRRWQGGLRFWPYHIVVLTLFGVCGWALRFDPPYALATPLLRLLAGIGLFCLLRDFVWQPAREAIAAGARAAIAPPAATRRPAPEPR